MEKTSVIELQEYCRKLNISDPEYKKIKKTKDRIFYQLTIIGKANEFGTGISENDAKDNAAAKVLLKFRKNYPLNLESNENTGVKLNVTADVSLSDVNNDEENSTENINNDQNISKLSNSEEMKIEFMTDSKGKSGNVQIQDTTTMEDPNYHDSNTVGELKEICDKKHWNLPQYSFQSLSDNEPMHECTCKIIINDHEIISHGFGGNKKFAKQLAAKDAIKKLNDKNFFIDYKKDNYNIKGVFDLFEKLLNNKEINLIFESNDDTNVCDHLHAIAEQINCEDKYMEIDCDGTVFKCLLQLITHDDSNSIVNASLGISTLSMDDAKKIAAEKSILMLNILSKK